MNTNPRTKKYAQAFVAIVAVLLAFSSPAAADFSGDCPLAIYEHATIKGGLIFNTTEAGDKYECLYPVTAENEANRPVLYQDFTINLPAGATVKTARLYNYYTWSCWENNDFVGVPAQAKLTFTNTTTDETWSTGPLTHSYTPDTCDSCPNPIVYEDVGVVHYWDTKSQNYANRHFDFPGGTFAWNVTEYVTGSGTYNASICDPRDREQVGDERFCTVGFGLLVVYENPNSPEIEYGIAEGCDILMNRTGYETAENATTNATFCSFYASLFSQGFQIPAACTGTATLSTILCFISGQNKVSFNDHDYGASTVGGEFHITYDEYNDAGDYLAEGTFNTGNNVVRIQDRDDYESVHNAFLVVNGVSYVSKDYSGTGTETINWDEAGVKISFDYSDLGDGFTLNLLKYKDNPYPPFPVRELSRYFNLSVNQWEKLMEWPIRVELSYTDVEVSAAGIDESTLGIYYWNETWKRCSDTGVYTGNNTIWANIKEEELVWGIDEWECPLGWSPLNAGGEEEALPPDTTPPAAVTDLTTSTPTHDSITLTWTAPGDDGDTGTATTYDIRYSTSEIITESNWDSATESTGEPSPQLAGSSETFTVTGLSPSTTYYFALKTADEVPNRSPISNSPGGTTTALPDTTPPAGITNLSSLNGTTWINWTWTNPPPDSDFNYTVVYLNETWMTNTSSPFYNATGLASDTLYEIGTRTVGEVGNINGTWINGTAKTLPLPEDTTPPDSDFTLPPDTTSPAAVTGLTTSTPTRDSITLTWTAPGDDENTGTATTYDIRYSTSEIITESNWDSATERSTGEPSPQPPGSSETFTVTGLSPSTTYYFALKTADEVPNRSPISNSPGGTTTAPPETPYGYSTTGFPVTTNEIGTIKGGIYYKVNDVFPGTFLGSGSREVSTSFDVPDGAIIGRLYTGVWGGSPFKTGTVTLTFNGHEYPVREIKGNHDSPCGPDDTPGVYGSGCGVWANVYSVTPYLIPGASNSVYMKTNAPSSLPACSGSYGWDGRIYIMALVVVYENDSMPEITYWINEGAGLLLTGDSACGPGYSLTNFPVYFNGMIGMSNVNAARLWTLGFPHNCLPHPELNGNYIGDPNFTQSSSAYDFYQWDNLTSFLKPSNNNLYYYDPSPGYERVISAVFMVEHAQEQEDIINEFVSGIGPTADSLGVEDASGISGTYVEVPVNITNVMNGPVQGIRLRVDYNEGVLSLTNISSGDLASTWSSLQFGEDRHTMVIATEKNEDAIPDGSSGPVVLLNFSVIGSPGDTSPMNMTLIELSNPKGEVGTAPASNGTFAVLIPGSIVGRITYACNGTGIADVNVNLTKGITVNTIVTNETGYYNFTNVVPGSYLVHASKLRFYDNSTKITVIAGETTTADMMLLLKGDLNNKGGIIPDARCVVLMLRASVGDISGDMRYDLNGNGEIADVGDVVLLLRASTKDIELL